MNGTFTKAESIQELSKRDIETVSGGIIPLIAAAAGVLTGGGLTAGGIWLWNQYH